LLHPTKAHELIKEKAKQAVQKAKQCPPLKIEGPVTFEIEFKGPNQATMTTTLPTVTLIGPRTITFTCDDIVTAYKHMWGCVIIAMTATNGVLGHVNA
jgi:D-amino peptidase